MTLTQTKQTITDRDIKTNKVVSENTPVQYQNHKSNPLPGNEKKLLYDIDDAFKDNLISEDLYKKARQKLNSAANKTQAEPILHDPQKPAPNKSSNPNPQKAPKDKNGEPKPAITPLKTRISHRSIYDKIKNKLRTKALPKKTEPSPFHGQSPPPANIEPYPHRTGKKQTSDSSPQRKEKLNTRQKNKEKLKHHLCKIESDIHIMHRKLNPHQYIHLHNHAKNPHIPHAHKKKESENTSEAIKELRKKEQAFSGNIKSLDKIYKDDIISLESYEKNKKQIEKNIADIEDTILRTLEKDALDNLKERLENEIKTTFATRPFSIEHKKYREDIDALTKIYNLDLISRDEYFQKKEKLNARLNKTDTIISGIVEVLEEYKKELTAKIADNESRIEKYTKFSKEEPLSANLKTGVESSTLHPVSSQPEPQSIIKKIKSTFGITSKNTCNSTHNPVVAEMRKDIITQEKKKEQHIKK